MLQPVAPATIAILVTRLTFWPRRRDREMTQRARHAAWHCSYHRRVGVPMEILIWLGISAAVLLLVWAAAPHHARIVENRDVPGVESWD